MDPTDFGVNSKSNFMRGGKGRGGGVGHHDHFKKKGCVFSDWFLRADPERPAVCAWAFSASFFLFRQCNATLRSMLGRVGLCQLEP